MSPERTPRQQAIRKRRLRDARDISFRLSLLAAGTALVVGDIHATAAPEYKAPEHHTVATAPAQPSAAEVGEIQRALAAHQRELKATNNYAIGLVNRILEIGNNGLGDPKTNQQMIGSSDIHATNDQHFITYVVDINQPEGKYVFNIEVDAAHPSSGSVSEITAWQEDTDGNQYNSFIWQKDIQTGEQMVRIGYDNNSVEQYSTEVLTDSGIQNLNAANMAVATGMLDDFMYRPTHNLPMQAIDPPRSL